MKWKKFDHETLEAIKALTLSGIILLGIYFVMRDFTNVIDILNSILKALSPFIIGFIFAFLLNPIRKIVEERWLLKMMWQKSTKRLIASLFAILVMLMTFIIFFAILIPQLYSSIQTFTKTFPSYIKTVTKLIESLHWNLNDIADIWQYLNSAVESFLSALQQWLKMNSAEGIGRLYNSAISFASSILNFFIGIIIAFYLLLDGDKLQLQMRHFTYALLPSSLANSLCHIIKKTVDTFNNFIAGKALDSLIIGIICYIGCLILKIPYAPLVAVIVGVTNMIPVFGPFIGGIPVVIMIALINPFRGLILAIFILILQQVDGNIIGPRILGSAVGLPSIWVMFAIIIGGALFGIVGMIIGVPIFSVIYDLIKDWTQKKLKEKQAEINK